MSLAKRLNSTKSRDLEPGRLSSQHAIRGDDISLFADLLDQKLHAEPRPRNISQASILPKQRTILQLLLIVSILNAPTIQAVTQGRYLLSAPLPVRHLLAGGLSESGTRCEESLYSMLSAGVGSMQLPVVMPQSSAAHCHAAKRHHVSRSSLRSGASHVCRASRVSEEDPLLLRVARGEGVLRNWCFYASHWPVACCKWRRLIRWGQSTSFHMLCRPDVSSRLYVSYRLSMLHVHAKDTCGWSHSLCMEDCTLHLFHPALRARLYVPGSKCRALRAI